MESTNSQKDEREFMVEEVDMEVVKEGEEEEDDKTVVESVVRVIDNQTASEMEVASVLTGLQAAGDL